MGPDPRFRREPAAWVHPNRSASRDGMPGYAFGMGDVASVLESLVVRAFDLGKGQAARDRQPAMGSPVPAVLGTEGDTVADWVAAGRPLARLETDGARSIEKTDRALGVAKAFLPATTRPLPHMTGADVAHPALGAARAADATHLDVGFTGAEEPTDPELTAAQRRQPR